MDTNQCNEWELRNHCGNEWESNKPILEVNGNQTIHCGNEWKSNKPRMRIDQTDCENEWE